VKEKKEVLENTNIKGRMSDSKDLKEVGDGNVVAAVRWRGGKGEDQNQQCPHSNPLSYDHSNIKSP
jgi:hypothetical protein